MGKVLGNPVNNRASAYIWDGISGIITDAITQPNLDEISLSCGGPGAVADWILKNITYIDETVYELSSSDYWQSAVITHRLRGGDNEDLVVLFQYMISVIGITGTIISIKEGGSSFTVCSFEQDGLLFYFNQNGINLTSTTSQTDLITYISSTWTEWSILDSTGVETSGPFYPA